MPKRPTVTADRPTRKVFVGVPDGYYDMTPDEQDAVLRQMAEILMAKLEPLIDAKHKRKRAAKSNGRTA